MIYQNDKLRIRPFTERDMREKYVSWMHDPEVTKFNSHGLFPYTTQQQEAYWKGIDAGERIVWAIETKANQRLSPHTIIEHVGNASLQSINWINRSAEFAIVIGETRMHMKGVGTQALKWAMEHAFVKLGLNRVWTGTAEPNNAMRKVAMKARMKMEGVFSEGMWLNGNFVDVVTYGITREMWEGKRE